MSNIFETFSFYSLDDKQKREVKELFNIKYKEGEKFEFKYGDLINHHQDLSYAFPHHFAYIQSINPAYFPYLTDDERVF